MRLKTGIRLKNKVRWCWFHLLEVGNATPETGSMTMQIQLTIESVPKIITYVLSHPVVVDIGNVHTLSMKSGPVAANLSEQLPGSVNIVKLLW